MKNKELLVSSNPKSAFSESIKTIRTNLQFLLVNEDSKVILLTSPEPGDGKSFVSANLATAFTQENKKVLLIDGDLRKGRQHRLFKIENDKSKGYSNLILSSKDDNTIANFIVKTEIKNLDLLPSGAYPPNPSELLSSSNNKELIAYSEYEKKIPGIVRKDNVYGLQFHPEKSGQVGADILKAYKELILKW